MIKPCRQAVRWHKLFSANDPLGWATVKLTTSSTIITNSVITFKSPSCHLARVLRYAFSRRPSEVLNPNDSAGECLTLEDLGQLAREARENRGDSQEKAAAQLKLEQPNVSNAERGHPDAKQTLFRLIALYTDYEVDDTPHYRLVKKE